MHGLIPIIPRSRIFLVPYGHGNDMQFAVRFRDTWKKLPLWVRRRLLRHWREDQDQARTIVGIFDTTRCQHPIGWPPRNPAEYIISPRIELLSGWIGPRGDDIVDAPRHPPKEVGHTFARGHLLRFHAPQVDRMPVGVAECLIAHELAHAYQFANGIAEDLGPYETNSYEWEADAEDTLTNWGFEDRIIDKWAEEVGLTHVHVL
jgi:hypothetical protein